MAPATLTGTSTSQSLFLDGKLVQTVALAGTLSVRAYQYLGAGRTGAGWKGLADQSNVYFTGQIAQAAIYDTALSTAQIAEQWAQYHASSGTVATETVRVTDPGGRMTASRFDLSNGGRILSRTDGDGGTTSYGYDTGGFVRTVTDPSGNVMTTGHDTRGNALTRTTCQDRSAAKCSTSYYTYYLNPVSAGDPRNDQILTSSDGRSADATDTAYRTTYSYDANGNKLTETSPPVDGHPDGLTTRRTYTTNTTPGYLPGTTAPAGLLASVTTPGGAQTSYVYFANGDLAETIAPSGLRTLYEYDQLGRALTTTISGTGFSNVTHYVYDAQGRVLTQTDPPVTDRVDGSTTHTLRTDYTYDDDGNTLSTTASDTTGGDAARTVTDTYNAQGRLESETDPLGHETHYTYDAYGNRATEADPGGQHYSFTYDASGHLLTTTLDNYTGSTAAPTDPAAQLMEKRTYRPDGRLDTVTDAIGVTTTYDYYDNGLTKQVTAIGASGTTFVDEQDTYDAAGNLTEQVSKNGTLVTRHTVDAANRLLTETEDPSGLAITTAYTYDADSHVLTEKTTDAAGDLPRQLTYTYDDVGNKKSAAQQADASTTLTTTWTYDKRGLATTMTDPRQQTYTYDYDEAGRPARTVAPETTVTSPVDGSTATVTPTSLVAYDTFGEQTKNEDPLGNITVTAYDAGGRKTATTLPSYTPAGATAPIPATTAWEWDDDGNLRSMTDAAGHTTDYTYDQLGNQVSRTNPAISVAGSMTRGPRQSSYDLAGNQLTDESPYGAVTHTTYDDLGRPDSTWGYVYLSAGFQSKVQSTTAYSPAGEVASTTSVTGVTQSATYDPLGRRVTSANTSGDTTHYTYGLTDAVTGTALPDGSSHTATYDAAGRMTGTADRDANGAVLRTTSAAYDAGGNVLSTTDALHTTETFSYDALGHLLTQTEPVTGGHAITTHYGYDAVGNKTAYTNGNGNTTSYTYTSWGLPETKVVPATADHSSLADRTTTQAYDSLGRATTTTLPGGVVTTNAYDALGDLTAQTGSGAEVATQDRTFSYSLDQNMVASTAGSAQETYQTNSLGQLLSASGQAGDSSFGYNADGSLLTRTDAAGTSTYTYDTDGRPATMADPATGSILTYGYNSLSQLTGVTLGAGKDTRAFGYDTLHRLASDTLTSPSGAQVAAISYGYDDADRLTSRTTSGFAGAGQNAYGYDLAGRLTSWTSTPTATGVATTTPYTYDDDGNRTGAGSTAYTYDARDQLVSDGTSTYGYTARGTTTGSTVTTTGFTTPATFDAYGQQITAGGTTYTYDALGRTTAAGSSPLAYSGQDNMLAADGAGTYTHDGAGSLVAVAASGTPTLAYTDLHTDLVGEYTPDATTLTGSAAYDPWGTPTATGTLTGNVGYQSEYTDPESGQVNMHARWYTPASGTFTSTDTVDNPAVGTSANANPFTYGNDNPLTGVDPSGHGTTTWRLGPGTVAAAVGLGLAATCAQSCKGLSQGLTRIGNGVNSLAWGKSSISAATLAHIMGLPIGIGAAVNARPISVSPSAWGNCAIAWSQACAGHFGPSSAFPGAYTTPRGGGGGGGGGGGLSPSGFDPRALLAAAAAAAAARAAEIKKKAEQLTKSVGKATLTIASAAVAAPPASRINIPALEQDPSGDPESDPQRRGRGGDGSPVTRAPSTCLDTKIPGSEPNVRNGGWEYYAPTGYGGRSQGAVVCAAHKNGMGYVKPGEPAGSVEAQQKATQYGGKVNSCHLAPSVFGGRGLRANVAACWRKTNADGRRSMRAFETRAEKASRGGNVVLYTGLPDYATAKSTIPIGFYLGYVAQDPATGAVVGFGTTYVRNDGQGLLPNLGN